jgi:hypothetical protein
MGLYNFQRRFLSHILAGQKTYTIRAIRKHPDKPGIVAACWALWASVKLLVCLG